MNPATDFLLISDAEARKTVFQNATRSAGYSLVVASSFADALKSFEYATYRAVFFDLASPALEPLQVLEWLKTRSVASVLCVMAVQDQPDLLRQALRLKATQIVSLSECDHADQLESRLKLLIADIEAKKNQTHREVNLVGGKRGVWVSNHAPVQMALERVHAEAKSRKPLLICGEEGTGKKFLLEILHGLLPEIPCVSFDATKLSDDQHAAIWHSAIQAQENLPGDYLLCINGIDRLNLALQEELACALMAGKGLVTTDQRFRLVATAQIDSEESFSWSGIHNDLRCFLEDPILLPPLRQREGDLPLLVDHFVNQRQQRPVSFATDAMTALLAHNWPANICELSRVVNDVLGKLNEPLVYARFLPRQILECSFYRGQDEKHDLGDFQYAEAKRLALEDFNRNYIDEVLRRSQNNLTVAAEIAGMDRSNFKKILRKYGKL